MKKSKIQTRLNKMEEHLRNAEEYVVRNQNVKGTSWFHFKDWEGKSGHPLWMKNFMIPTVKRARACAERALEKIMTKKKEKNLQEQKQSEGIGSCPQVQKDIVAAYKPKAEEQ